MKAAVVHEWLTARVAPTRVTLRILDLLREADRGLRAEGAAVCTRFLKPAAATGDS